MRLLRCFIWLLFVAVTTVMIAAPAGAQTRTPMVRSQASMPETRFAPEWSPNPLFSAEDALLNADDTLLEGILLGGLIGLVSVGVLVARSGGEIASDERYVIVVGIGLGAMIGAMIDAAH